MDNNLNTYKWLDAAEVRDASAAEKRADKAAASFNKQINYKMLDLLEQL